MDQPRVCVKIHHAVVLQVELYDYRWLEHHARTIIGGWWTQRPCHEDTGADRSKLTLIKAQFSALNTTAAPKVGHQSGKLEATP